MKFLISRYSFTLFLKFCNISFQLEMDLKKQRNKAVMKERKKTILYLQKHKAGVR